MEVPRLHPDTIEEVRQRVDIVEIVSDYVTLHKRGKDYLGLCPFHEEKSPSFSVSPSKQLYYCFGCGQGGNAFSFLMELGKRPFGEVVFDLARRYQVPLKTLDPEQRQELQRQLSLREQLYEILALAASFYQHALRQPQGEKALDYLKGERQLTEGTIQHFQLGYAPAGWETLYRYLVEQKRYPLASVEGAGLIKKRQSGDGYYDRFRDRLTIPIHDLQGRVVGFGSRTLGTEEPKYLNSPETQLFDKGKILFALDKAKQSIQKLDRTVVVEGYFDAIALHGAGITNAVACLGTAFSEAQLRQLLRYTPSQQVTFNFDADAAGIQAVRRAIGEIEPLVYSGRVQVRILTLPEGKDADEFLRSHPGAADRYRQLLEGAPLWLDWQVQQLLVGKDLKQADHFEQVGREMVKLLNRLEDDHKRAYYLRSCAEILSQGDARLVPLQVNALLAQLRKPRLRSPDRTPKSPALPPPGSGEKSLLEEAEALLLLIYLHCPEQRLKVLEALEERDLVFSLSQHRFLWQQVAELQGEGDPGGIASPSLLSQLQDRCLAFPEQMGKVAHLFHLNEKTAEDIFRAPLRIEEAIAALERVAWENYRRHCLQQWQQLDRVRDRDRWQYYSQEFYAAGQQIQKLDRLRLAQAQQAGP